MEERLCLQSARKDLAQSRVHREPVPQPAEGEVLLRISLFSLTANNITYGAAGDMIGYWQFFPAEGDWGCIPVWGYAEVVASQHEAIAVGKRIWGYYPMATHVLLQPAQVSMRGFVDGATHRAELPAIYNRYEFTDADPSYAAELEPELAIYRGLFTTGFLIDAFLAQQGFFGAQQIVLSSASSKTAFSAAMFLHQRGEARPKLVGLTSAGNVDFVRRLGCYDTVLSYDEVGELAQEASVYVDMAGSATLRTAVHEHLGQDLKYSCAVGMTHWQDAAGGQALPGPTPTLFFAPAAAEQCIADWGPEGFAQRISEAVGSLVERIRGLVTVEHVEGADGLQALYTDFVTGKATPNKGYVVSL